MDSPVTFGRTISPVCLPSAGSTANYEGKVAAVIGWGALKEGTKTKTKLVAYSRIDFY